LTYLEQLFSLEGKVAMVTGAGRGIGRGIAEALLKARAAVILVGSDSTRLSQTTDAFKEQGLRAFMRHCDLMDRGQTAGLIEYAKQQHGRVDVLVNNAGVTFGHSLWDYPEEAWARTLRINLEAAFELSRGLAGLMREQEGGSIINITSLSAELGSPDNPAYAASKGALKQLTKSLAADLGAYGIRVNNVGPGYFRTDMTKPSWNDRRLRAKRTERTLLGRWGVPDDLAGLIVLLASDASAYLTGQDIYVDGGWLTKCL